MKSIILFFSAVGSIVAWADSPPSTGVALPTGVPSYSRDIQPMFKSRCTMCHGPGKMNPKDWTDYKTAVANKDVMKLRVVVQKTMPMGGWDQPSRDKVGAWIDGGTPQ